MDDFRNQKYTHKFYSEIIHPLTNAIDDNYENVRHEKEKLQDLLNLLDLSLKKHADKTSDNSKATPENQTKKQLETTDKSETTSTSPGTFQTSKKDRTLSRLRELVILDFLSTSYGNQPLSEVVKQVKKHNFLDPSEKPIIAQLHRLHEKEIITKPAYGLYAISESGRNHLKNVREQYGKILDQYQKNHEDDKHS